MVWRTISSSAAGDHAALTAVLRRLVLSLQVVLRRRHDTLHPAAALRVHAAPLGPRILEPDLARKRGNNQLITQRGPTAANKMLNVLSSYYAGNVTDKQPSPFPFPSRLPFPPPLPVPPPCPHSPSTPFSLYRAPSQPFLSSTFPYLILIIVSTLFLLLPLRLPS